MDMHAGLIVAAWSIGLLATSTATWAACRWWYGQKLSAAAARLQKSDKGRLFSQQQAQQARKQVEHLKAELAAHRQAAVDSTASRQRTRDLESALVVAQQAIIPVEIAARPVRMQAPSCFADTQIMS